MTRYSAAMMKPVITATLLAFLVTTAAAPVAEARASCYAQAKSIKAGQKEAKALQADRDALLEEVEAAGDEWEAAEQSRLFGAEEAAKADAAKQTYETLKADLVSMEDSLQGQVSDLNAAVSTYNDRCATKK